MARYRKIDPRIWNDQKFRALSDNGKLAFLFLLTHPHMTAIGAMRATIPGLAQEIGWTVDAMSDAIRHAMSLGMVDANEEASYMGLRSFLKYNEPEGPNSVLKAWPAALDLIPECPEKGVLARRVKDYLIDKGEQFFGKADTDAMWHAIEDAIVDAMSEPSPIQEQEQEQEQEQDKPRSLTSFAPIAKSPPSPIPKDKKPQSTKSTRKKSETELPADFDLTEEMVKIAEETLGDQADARMLFSKFVDYHRGKASRFADWPAVWRNWCRNGLQYGFPRKNGHMGSAQAKADAARDLLKDVLGAKVGIETQPAAAQEAPPAGNRQSGNASIASTLFQPAIGPQIGPNLINMNDDEVF